MKSDSLLQNLLEVSGVMATFHFDDQGTILDQAGDEQLLKRGAASAAFFLAEIFKAFAEQSVPLDDMTFRFEEASIVVSRYENLFVAGVVNEDANLPFVQTSMSVVARQLRPGASNMVLPLFGKKQTSQGSFHSPQATHPPRSAVASQTTAHISLPSRTHSSKKKTTPLQPSTYPSASPPPETTPLQPDSPPSEPSIDSAASSALSSSITHLDPRAGSTIGKAVPAESMSSEPLAYPQNDEKNKKLPQPRASAPPSALPKDTHPLSAQSTAEISPPPDTWSPPPTDAPPLLDHSPLESSKLIALNRFRPSRLRTGNLPEGFWPIFRSVLARHMGPTASERMLQRCLRKMQITEETLQPGQVGVLIAHLTDTMPNRLRRESFENDCIALVDRLMTDSSH